MAFADAAEGITSPPLVKFHSLIPYSGKSSLILSLFHMIETTSGSTWIANLDISTIPRDLVRNRLLAAPQDPLPLCGTVRYNVDPLQLHSDEAITTALTKVELWNTVREKGSLDLLIEDIVSVMDSGSY